MLIACLFVATRVVTSYRGRQLHAVTDKTMRDALTSAELIGRMGRDLSAQRQVIDTHIAAQDRAGMAAADARLVFLDKDFVEASTEYAPLADLPEEVRVWRSLVTDVSATRPYMTAVLDLSHQNRDAEARQQLPPLDERFALLADEIGQLVTLNRVGVTRSLAELDRMQNELNLLIAGLALAGILLTGIVGSAAIGLVHRREQQLTRYSLRLEEQNRELDAFAGRVAHDLRSPLTGMRLALWRLVNDLPEGSVDTTFVDRSIGRMDALIHDLLSLSRIEALAREGSCDPSAVASALRDELAPKLEAADGTIQVEVEPACVRCGEGLLTEALSNLADNAIKYHRPDAPPRITITGHGEGRSYELRVADNGIGMTQDERRKLFAPFFRARRDRKVHGTGLGLSIVKRIAEANGGDVAVESTLGQGTTFVIRLLLGEH
jgi:signal transduction histidine kinase